MKNILIAVFLFSPFFVATLWSQRPIVTPSIPAKPNYYDYLNYYLSLYPTEGEGGEGGVGEQVKKDAIIWAERLFPSGSAAMASMAIQDYAKYFNTHPNQTCTQGSWTCLGPIGKPALITGSTNCGPGNSGTGQVHNIRFSPNYASDQTIYGCSTWGGLWRSTNGGASWSVLNTDTQLPFTCVSDIAIHPTTTSTLYICTGESERGLGHWSIKHDENPSAFTPLFTAGVYRSTNSGSTWQPINGANEALLDFFPEGGLIRRIRLHPVNPNRVFITTSAGLFKTDNASVTNPVWIKLTNTITDSELKGLEFHPITTGTMYISGKDIYRTNNNGNTWNSMTGPATGLDLNALPNGFLVGRINIAVTPASPNNVYAYIIGTDINPNCTCARSNRAYIYVFNGTTWSQKDDITDYQTNICPSTCKPNGINAITTARSSIAVSPTNPNELYYGTTKVRGSKTIDDQSTFVDISPYLSNEFHADVIGLAFEPGTNYLFASTDGGIHKKNLATSGTGGWTDISIGLGLSTPYRFDDSDDRIDRIMMGNQDCGTFIYTTAGGWRNIQGGDGYNGKIDGVSGTGYGQTNATADNLFVYDFNTNTCDFEDRNVQNSTFPTDPQPDQGLAWMRGSFDMINHPSTEKMHFTLTEVYERLKPKRAAGDGPNQLWKIRSDVGKFIPYQWQRQLQVFDISESNPNYIYIVQNGVIIDQITGGFSLEPKLFRSTTGGCDGLTGNGSNGYNNSACFTEITSNLINSGITTSYQPINGSALPITIPVITGIIFHPENHLKAWITFTGYEPTVKVWKTIDGGVTWTNADPSGSLHNLPVNDIIYQRGSNDRLYIGTDAGIWFKDASMTDWQKFCDFPNVRVMELKINYCVGKLRAATFGRSIWEANLLSSTGTLGQSELVIATTPTLPWTQSRGLDRNLRIKKGATLTIQGPSPTNKISISLPKNGRIIVEDGAKLVVTNAILTNNCGKTWLGIQLWGNDAKRQIPADQGYLVLTDAVIEHANEAVITWDSVTYDKAGGVVQAVRTFFKNNKRSTEFIEYENTNSLGYVIDNLSIYEECTFSIDDNFRFPNLKYHISMYRVRGVRFLGCTFEYVKTGPPPAFHVEECSGIRTIDATPIVGGKCTTTSNPCGGVYIRSKFKGFNKGIYTTGTMGTYAPNISRTDFENNIIGMESDVMQGTSVRACTFKVGKTGSIPGAPACHEGLILGSETGFTVDENVFEPTFTTSFPKTLGIRVRESGGAPNKIYRNTFKKTSTSNVNVFYGNLANGNNRSTANGDIGLQYLCNTNQNNILGGYDFAVEDGNGIAGKQGSLSIAAMNLFSKGTSVLGSDFTNAVASINYYCQNTSGVYFPSNIQTINTITILSAPPGTCPNLFDGTGGGEPAGIMTPEEQYSASSNSFELLNTKLSILIDGGDTPALLKKIEEANSSNAESVRLELRSITPYLSTAVVSAILDKYTLFDKTFLQEIIKGNPDVVKTDLLNKIRAEGLFTEQELAQLSAAISRAVTSRTEKEDLLHQHQVAMSHAANQVIHSILNNENFIDLDKLISWCNHKPDVESAYEVIDIYLQQGKVQEASALLASLPLKFSFNPGQAREYENFSILKNLQIAWTQNNTNPFALDEGTIQVLQQIAEKSQERAGGQARGLLNFAYQGNYFIPPVFPGQPTEEHTPEKHQPVEPISPGQYIQARPNPATDMVWFDCVVPEKVQKGFITIRDMMGNVVQRLTVSQGEVPVWKTIKFPSGTYVYTYEAGGKVLEAGARIVIIK